MSCYRMWVSGEQRATSAGPQSGRETTTERGTNGRQKTLKYVKYTYTCVYKRIYAHTHTYTHVYIHVHTYTHAHLLTCYQQLYTHTPIHINLHTQAYNYTCTNIHTCTHTYMYIHTRTHTHRSAKSTPIGIKYSKHFVFSNIILVNVCSQ